MFLGQIQLIHKIPLKINKTHQLFTGPPNNCEWYLWCLSNCFPVEFHWPMILTWNTSGQNKYWTCCKVRTGSTLRKYIVRQDITGIAYDVYIYVYIYIAVNHRYTRNIVHTLFGELLICSRSHMGYLVYVCLFANMRIYVWIFTNRDVNSYIYTHISTHKRYSYGKTLAHPHEDPPK